MNKYDVILFDVDDTLFDFRLSEKYAFQQSFEKFGYPNGLTDFRADYNQISRVLWGELEQGQITLAKLATERFKRLFIKHNLPIDPNLFSRTYLTNLGQQAHLMPGALELCKQLDHTRLAIITNGFTDVQLSRIANSPLHNTFKAIITSEQVGISKPNPKIFDAVFSQLKLARKDNVLIVGDSLTSDMQGGMNYGIDTCWFNPNELDNKTKVRPTYEIKQLMDLLPIVKETMKV